MNYFYMLALLCVISQCAGARVDKEARSNNIIIGDPGSNEARVPKFVGLDASFLNDSFANESEILAYKNKIEQRNKCSADIWQRKEWNLNYYQEQNLPIVVGKVEDSKLFSSRYNGNGLRFLDLPIYMPKQGWRMPVELEQFKEVVKMAVEHERLCNPFFENDHYVYITVDQGIVPPYTAQRRSGYHSDSYRKIDTHKSDSNVLVDHIYVICDSCPTLFVGGPFVFDNVNPEEIDQVLALFAREAAHKEKIVHEPYTLLRIDPYCVHDAGINKSDQDVCRTFVKISFSKTQYRHLGNAHNALFVYDWPMVPRYMVPYTKEAIVESDHRKDRDMFIAIDKTDIDFLNKRCSVEWADERIFTVVKEGYVYAEPATEGEMLETRENGFLVSINVAVKGDYKVQFAGGNYGFVDEVRFNQRYLSVPHRKNLFCQKKSLRRAVRLKKKVRMLAPWGTMHYADIDDYLVYIDNEEVYFVPQDIFKSSYRILD